MIGARAARDKLAVIRLAALVVALATSGCGTSQPTIRRLDLPGSTADGASGSPPDAAGATGSPVGGSPSPTAFQVRAAVLALRLPIGVSRAVRFVDGGTVLLVGGLTATGTTAAVVRLALPAGPIGSAGQLPVPVHDAAGAALGGQPLVLGGGNLTPVATVQELSGVVGSLPAARADLAAVDLGGVVYVVGGGTSAKLETAVLASTDGIHFGPVATLLLGARYPAVAAVNGRIIVVGGTDGAHDRAAIQVIDPSIGSVRRLADLPLGLSHAAALVIDGHLLVLGGRSGGVAQRAIWDVDPLTGRAVQVGNLPHAVSDAAAVVLGGVGYLIGGERASQVAEVVQLTAG